MEDATAKQDNQTTWYENGQLIAEYLESSKKPSKSKEVSRKEKLSLLNLLKNARGNRR